jgi:integrase
MKSIHVKPTTLVDYDYQCVLAIEQIGAYRLDDVTREVADALVAYYFRRGYQNVGQLLMVMKQAFGYALESDYVTRNPFAKVKAPPIQRKPTIVLTESQRGHVLICGATEDTPDIPLSALWHLYSRLAFRRGEGIGLRWSDIDLDDGTIAVKQNTVQAGRQVVTHTPKTKRSTRLIPVPPDIVAQLRALRAWQIRRAAADPEWQMSGRVFVDAHGAALTIWHVEWRWKRLRKRAGIQAQVTIHGLRHTALSIMEKAKTPASIVQAFAGHSSATMTRLYTDHTTIEQMRTALEG